MNTVGVIRCDSCVVVIPCFNEEATVARVIRETIPFIPRIIVVDDGSGDRTAQEAAGAGARVMSHPHHCGKGAALQTGLAAACNDGFAWAVTMDGDGQHRPEDIPKLLDAVKGDDLMSPRDQTLLECGHQTVSSEPLVAGCQPAIQPTASRRYSATSRVDMVVGNRMDHPIPMSILRLWTNRWMSRRLSRLAGQPMPDSQCGFRLVRLAAWSRFMFESKHFEIESEMLIAFARGGCRVVFVPIQTAAAMRPSRIHPMTDTVRWLLWWWRNRSVNNNRLPKQTSQ